MINISAFYSLSDFYRICKSIISKITSFLASGAWFALCLILGSIIIFPIVKSAPFFFEHAYTDWLQMEWDPDYGDYGFIIPIVGSLMLSLLTLPLTLILGWFLAYQLIRIRSDHIQAIVRTVLETWIALPSVVVGLWALCTILPMVRSLYGNGHCLLTACIGLSVFFIPSAALLFEKSYKEYQVQFANLESSYGFTMAESTFYYIKSFPLAVYQICNYMFCRIFGETMIVLMLSGNALMIPSTFFESTRTITATVALEMSYAAGDHEQALYALAAVSIVLVTLLLLIQRGVKYATK